MAKPRPKPHGTDNEAAKALVRSGRAQLRRGSYSRAKADFRRALQSDPRLAAAHGGLGEVAFEEGNHGAASKHLRDAIRLNPRNTRYLVMLGNVYFKQGKTKQAVVQYRRALRYEPNNAEARSGLQAAIRRMAGN